MDTDERWRGIGDERRGETPKGVSGGRAERGGSRPRLSLCQP